MFLRLSAAMSVIVLSGCASIVSGGTQQLSFNSEPQEATVYVAGKALGKTPLTVEVPRDKNQALVFEKDGYKTYSTQLSTTMNGWFWGNIVFGGFLGSTTDSVSGSIHEYSPNTYYVTLVPVEKPFGMDTSAPRNVRQFVIAIGPQLRQQLVAGAGEDLNALLTMIGAGTEVRSEAIAALRRLAQTTTDDFEFATKIVDVYEIK